MTTYEAVEIVEGYSDSSSEEQTIEAWQFLINSGVCWKLQGWYGRTAEQLIYAGVCYKPETLNNPTCPNVQ
tara:strand:+ start:522 stop:734 length:213 start_codon:yes stop_codon:yes gene_type:complete